MRAEIFLRGLFGVGRVSGRAEGVPVAGQHPCDDFVRHPAIDNESGSGFSRVSLLRRAASPMAGFRDSGYNEGRYIGVRNLTNDTTIQFKAVCFE